ncbi:putative reverse transcriptase domain-containing protein [Tanacetum coccineum]
MSYNERFMPLFILEMSLEAKEHYVIRLGHVGGLEGDEERLEDVLYKLESSFDVLVTPCEAAAKERRKEVIAPILALREGSEDFIVYCDASKKGLGAVLMQREGDCLCITPAENS